MPKTSYLLLLVAVTLLSFISCSKKQYGVIHTHNTEEPYMEVEQVAQFPGGEEEMTNWISSRIQYPVEAARKGIEGRVVIRFVVDKEGNVQDPEIMRGVDNLINEEALRLVKEMPKWIPAENNGKKVSMYFILPVTFKLDKPIPREESEVNMIHK